MSPCRRAHTAVPARGKHGIAPTLTISFVRRMRRSSGRSPASSALLVTHPWTATAMLRVSTRCRELPRTEERFRQTTSSRGSAPMDRNRAFVPSSHRFQRRLPPREAILTAPTCTCYRSAPTASAWTAHSLLDGYRAAIWRRAMLSPQRSVAVGPRARSRRDGCPRSLRQRGWRPRDVERRGPHGRRHRRAPRLRGAQVASDKPGIPAVAMPRR